MEDRSILINQFQDYANSLGHGYLKTWKASSMILSLKDLRDPFYEDNIRLYNYLANCLEMEGFRGPEIEKIQRWVIENVL